MLKNKSYENVILDIGDVLFLYRWKECIMDYGVSAEEAQRIGDEIFEGAHGLWGEWDLGTYSVDELDARYREEYPEDADIISFFLHHGEYMHKPRPAVWKMVHEVKQAGYKIYLLSNYSEELFNKHTQYADFLRDIDGKIVSYEHGVKKPDPRIYQILFETYHLDPAECIFFDDRRENCDAAIAEGMDAI